MYIKIFTQQHIIKSAAETPVQLGRLKIAATEAKQLKYNSVVLGLLHGVWSTILPFENNKDQELVSRIRLH